MTLYALLVGIDAYRPPVSRLHGARNDVEAAERYLSSRLPAGDLAVKCLVDGQATRAAVIDGLRRHLGRAQEGDTALFWFSGHGSQMPVPPELARLEPTGLMQTMVCADSRHGNVPDLLDKELALLIGEVAARKAHVAVVLDCCHADGASREVPQKDLLTPGLPALGMRWEKPPEGPPEAGLLLPELRRLSASGGDPAAGPGIPDHVSLAACHSNQVAYEVPLTYGYRGLFSLALLGQLSRLGPDATYRELIAGARCQVEGVVPAQRPVLFPVAEEIADQPFLGGRLRLPQSAMLMRFIHGSWEIDAGACHGLPAGTGRDRVRIAVHGSDPEQEPSAAEVVEVLAERSIVKPLNWVPNIQKQYPVVVVSVPLPAVAVSVGGGPGDDPATVALIKAAVSSAAPGGRTSPHLNVIGLDDTGRLPEIRIACPQPGVARILHADLRPQAPDAVCESPDGADSLVRDLEQIAQWRRIRSLENPMSGLGNAVSIEVVAARPGESTDPRDRPGLLVGRDGSIPLRYRWEGNRWIEPRVFIRLRNNTDRPLFCVLLDLTDRFRMDPKLFTGDWVAPGYAASAANGNLVTMALPPGRDALPGARVTDWLKVLVAEKPFSSAPFRLPRLGEPPDRRALEPVAFRGVLDRLGLAARFRDAEIQAPPAHDWTTGMAAVVTRVPRNRT